MSDLDLTEAHNAALEVADREAPGIIRATVIYDIADAAIAKIERQVRERIAAAIEEDARMQNMPRRNALRHAARIARAGERP